MFRFQARNLPVENQAQMPSIFECMQFYLIDRELVIFKETHKNYIMITQKFVKLGNLGMAIMHICCMVV